MKEIVITKEFKVQVDDEDFDKVSKYNWYAVKGKNTYYAYTDTRSPNNVEGKQFPMHKLILNIVNASPAILIDHIDGNGLNNQKLNLRKATNQQNCFNVEAKAKNKTAKFKGVYKTESGKYEAQIKLNYKSNSLGRYTLEETAAKVYDAVARFYMKDFAYCNFEEVFIKPMSITDAKANVGINNRHYINTNTNIKKEE